MTKTKDAKKPVYKKKKNGKNATGRDAKLIDIERVRKMSEFHFTDRELAVGLNVSFSHFSHKKLNDPRIAEAIAEGQAKGKMSLRRKQFQLAQKGDRQMLIWLGKNTLDQRDKFLHGNDPDHPLPPTKNTYNFATPEEGAAAFDKRIREGVGG